MAILVLWNWAAEYTRGNGTALTCRMVLAEASSAAEYWMQHKSFFRQEETLTPEMREQIERFYRQVDRDLGAADVIRGKDQKRSTKKNGVRHG